MVSNQYQGAVMTLAIFDDGSKSPVQFWVPEGGKANGFCLRDGRMIRADVQGDFVNYEVA